MGTKFFIRILVIGIILMSIITIVSADGGFFQPAKSAAYGPEKDITLPAQKAVIIYENNTEDLILQVKYEGEVENFAWVVPLPNRPTINVSQPELFFELFSLTVPEYLRMIRPGGGEKPVLVEVIERKTVGIYDVAVLYAEDPEALTNWLNLNGYFFPTEGKAILDYYINKEWYFVAMKININITEKERLKEGTIQPIRLSFESEKIIYPLKITSLSADESEILLYIFTNQSVAPKNYTCFSIKNIGISSNYELLVHPEKRVKNAFYLEFGDQINYDETWGSLNALLNKDYYLTKLRGNIESSKMNDIEFEVVDENGCIKTAEARAAEWVNEGNALISSRYEEAIKAFDKATEINPQYDIAWYEKGIALANSGNYWDAVDAFDKAIEINPEYKEAWYEKGIALAGAAYDVGGYEEAIKAYDKAIEIHSGYARAWKDKGVALLNIGRYKDAVDAFDKAIKINPKYEEAWREKGIALIYLGKNEEAKKTFNKLKKIKQLMVVTEISPEVTQAETNQPGFEAVFTIIGLLSVAYLVLRMKRR